eukprot:495074-Pleurochrysis_carterae.AAC.2
MAALAKMNALSESLRSSMPEAEESRPGTANTKAGTPSSIRRSSMREDGKRNSVVPGGNRRAGRDGAGDMAQLAADYDEVRQRYEEVLKENESLKADANRRIESNLRREKKYEFELNELRGELARQARGPTGDSMDRLREEHKYAEPIAIHCGRSDEIPVVDYVIRIALSDLQDFLGFSRLL